MSVHLVLRCTESCNLECAYCYVRKRDTTYLDLNQLDRVYQMLLEAGISDRVEIVWHGGEPLMLGPSYLHEALKRQTEFGQVGLQFVNCIQTNATLVTPELCDLFSRFDLKVGVSVDAPPNHHRALRRAKGGGDSFGKTMEGITALRAKGVDFSAISVLTKQNVNRAREVYEFFSELGIPFKLNPCIPSENSGPQARSLQVSPDEYGDFLCEMLDIYMTDPAPRTRVTDIDDIVKSLLTGMNRNCLYSADCRNFFGMSPEGDMYFCDLFYRDEFLVGRFATLRHQDFRCNAIVDMLEARQRRLATACGGCRYWHICHGGCPAIAFEALGDSCERDYFCPSRRQLFERADYYVSHGITTASIPCDGSEYPGGRSV